MTKIKILIRLFYKIKNIFIYPSNIAKNAVFVDPLMFSSTTNLKAQRRSSGRYVNFDR
jgi:hypothetical protein